MRVILHIGSEKTGTTSLQATLTKFRTDLVGAGVLFPLLLPQDNHSILAVPFYHTAIPREFYQKMGEDKTDADAIAFAYWGEVKAQVTAHPECDTLLISGEHFLNIDDHAALSRYLANLFPRAEIEVLCYLREPVSYYTSYLQQRIKASSKLFWPGNDNWADKLTAWRRVGRLTIREFAGDQLVGRDIVSDVMACIDTGLAARCTIDSVRTNEGISPEAAHILQSYRMQIHPDRDDLFLPDSQRLFIALQRAEGHLPKPKSKARLKQGVAEFARLQALPDLLALQNDLGFTFRDESLYDAHAVRCAYTNLPPLKTSPASMAAIFRLRESYLRMLQAEAFAQLLQGFATRERYA